MKKFILIIFLIFLILSPLLFGEALATFPDLLKPKTLLVEGDYLYISQEANIFIHSMKDFKLLKKFGRQGQGPQEFVVQAEIPLTMEVFKEQLLVNSMGKISFFKMDGTFIKELRTGKGFSLGFKALSSGGYVGMGISLEEGILYVTINHFDEKLKKGKMFFKMKSPFQQDGSLSVLKKQLAFQTHGDKVLVVKENGFAINIYNMDGTKEYTFKQENYKRRKFTPEDEKIIREIIKVQARGGYEAIKNKISFPDYFPEILNFFIDQEKLYVATWEWDKDKILFYIFDMKGKKLLKKQYIPFVFQDAIQPYPAVVKNGVLYQLIENEDEEWELHANPIK